MQHDEAGRCAISFRIAFVEFADLHNGTVEQRLIRIDMLGIGIRPVAQQRELSVGLWIRQEVQLQLMHQRGDGFNASEHRGNHHHHAMLDGNPVDERNARQVRGPCGFTDQAIDDRNHRFRGREHHQNNGTQRQTSGRIGTG